MAKEWRPAGRLNCRLVYTHLSRSGNNGCAFSVPKFYIVYLCLACAPAQSQSQYEQWTPHNRSHVWCLCDYIIWIVEKYTTASIVYSIAKSAEMVELLFKIIELWWHNFRLFSAANTHLPIFRRRRDTSREQGIISNDRTPILVTTASHVHRFYQIKRKTTASIAQWWPAPLNSLQNLNVCTFDNKNSLAVARIVITVSDRIGGV